jgi:glycine cleavage system H protein
MTSKIIEGLYYTKTEEWLRVEGDIGIVGITDYAQDQLGDIVYLEETEKGRKVKQGQEFTAVESVKAATDISAPVSGEVIDVNMAVVEDSSLMNSDPYGEGWIVKIKMDDPEELKNIMDDKEYTSYSETREA